MPTPKHFATAKLTACFTALMLLIGTTVLAEEPATVNLTGGEELQGLTAKGCEIKYADGELTLFAGDGVVHTAEPCQDFVLELEWIALKEKDYDSGIYFRAELPEKSPWPKRFQINLRQAQEGKLLGVKNITGDVVPKNIKAGDWNHFKLTVQGGKASLICNGEPAWEATDIPEVKGYIALQSEVPLGGQYKFKNIKFTNLDAASN